MISKIELDNLDIKDLIDLFYGPNLGSEWEYYDEVAFRIRAKGKIGNAFLLKALKSINDHDEERLRAILIAHSLQEGSSIKPLARRHREILRDRLLFNLNHPNEMIVAEAISGLKWQKVKEALNVVLPFLNQPSPYIRCSALAYLAALHPDLAYPILIEALKDEHWHVRDSALDGLLHLHRPEAIPYIRPLLDDPNEIIRESAKQIIEWLEFEVLVDGLQNAYPL